MPKRYRSSSGYSNYSSKRYKTSTGAIPRRLRGYARTGGLYGRYSGQIRALRRRRLGLKPELKWFDTVENTPQAMVQAGSIWFPSLNLVSEGVGPQQMIGRKIVIKRITVRGYIQKASATGASIGAVESTDYVRFALIQDKQANGAAPSVADVYQQANSRGFLNLSNSHRFKVLKTWEMDLNATFNSYWNSQTNVAAFQSTNIIRHFDWTKRCSIPVEFLGNAGARVITDIKSNNLLVIGFCSGPNGTSAYTMMVRIRYEDS